MASFHHEYATAVGTVQYSFLACLPNFQHTSACVYNSDSIERNSRAGKCIRFGKRVSVVAISPSVNFTASLLSAEVKFARLDEPWYQGRHSQQGHVNGCVRAAIEEYKEEVIAHAKLLTIVDHTDPTITREMAQWHASMDCAIWTRFIPAAQRTPLSMPSTWAPISHEQGQTPNENQTCLCKTHQDDATCMGW